MKDFAELNRNYFKGEEKRMVSFLKKIFQIKLIILEKEDFEDKEQRKDLP